MSAGKEDEALGLFKRSFDLAGRDSLLRAETSKLKLKIFENRDQPGNQRDAWHDCADAYSEIGDHQQAALALARAGEIESTRLPYSNEARRSFRRAFDNYYQARNVQGIEEMREKLAALGEDVGALPVLGQTTSRAIPWFWIRLALELSILAVAAGLFYVSLR